MKRTCEEKDFQKYLAYNVSQFSNPQIKINKEINA